MIDKENITMKTEVWRDEKLEHRYVFRRTWYKGTKEDKEGPMAVVITIQPVSVEPFTTDLSMLLIEKNIRQLGFTGFIAVNLFSNVPIKHSAKREMQNSKESLEVIQTVLMEKRIQRIIFACGAITNTNQKAYDRLQEIYQALTPEQQKIAKVLVDGSNKVAHPVNVYVRNHWKLVDVDQLFTDKSSKNDTEI